VSESEQNHRSDFEGKMNVKKAYIWKLGCFLAHHEMTMSGEELAEHLNRNAFLTGYGSTYSGKRGTYRLIAATWEWLHNELLLEVDASMVARAFVTPDGEYAYKV